MGIFNGNCNGPLKSNSRCLFKVIDSMLSGPNLDPKSVRNSYAVPFFYYFFQNIFEIYFKEIQPKMDLN